MIQQLEDITRCDSRTNCSLRGVSKPLWNCPSITTILPQYWWNDHDKCIIRILWEMITQPQHDKEKRNSVNTWWESTICRHFKDFFGCSYNLLALSFQTPNEMVMALNISLLREMTMFTNFYLQYLWPKFELFVNEEKWPTHSFAFASLCHWKIDCVFWCKCYWCLSLMITLSSVLFQIMTWRQAKK